jgi:hypothetical protein
MVTKADGFVKKELGKIEPGSQHSKRVYFSPDFKEDDANITEKIANYRDAKAGIVSAEDTFDTVVAKVKSIHMATAYRNLHGKVTEIECDCIGFHHTGYCCSHVLATAHMLDPEFFNINAMLTAVVGSTGKDSTGRKRGRPPKSAKAPTEPDCIKKGLQVFDQTFGVGCISEVYIFGNHLLKQEYVY